MKRPRKKNVIPPARMEQLKNGSVYEIRCGTFDCGCDDPSAGCQRGFFSLFIQAVNGIAFAKRFRLDYFVNYGHTQYAYSQPGEGDHNFWNYYFEQPITGVDRNTNVVENELIEDYPLRIWDAEFIQGLAQVMSRELVFRQAVSDGFNQVKKKFEGQRILGVHFRSTDHPGEVAPVSIRDYFKQIDQRLPAFDKIFLATDDNVVVGKFKQRYGDKIIANEVIRSINGEALHMDKGNTDRYRLGFDALMDCYALSQCHDVLLTHSNLSYSALLFNPGLRYKLMERFQTRLKRLLTLTLYYLDKFNIRKW